MKPITFIIAIVALLLLGASPASAAVDTYSNTAPIAMPGAGTAGVGSPYPSSVSVAGKIGPVTDVKVTLHGVDHTRPNDLRMVLVSPTGRTVTLMSSNCGGAAMLNQNILFNQDAPEAMPTGAASCPGVNYRPDPVTNNSHLPSPAPTGPYGRTLDLLKGSNPNGTWELYIEDFRTGEVGQVRRGWTLTLSTEPEAVDIKIPAAGTFYVANPYPATVDVTGKTGVITDLDVSLPGVWHQRPKDLDLLLVGPQGQRVVLMSDACGTADPEGATWRWDDEADLAMPDGLQVCRSRAFRPIDYQPGETWPAPAPASPHGTRLSDFDLTDPNGQWRLYATDDETGAAGFVTNPLRLELTTRPRAAVAFTESSVRLGEGQARELTLRRSAADLKAASVRVTTAPGSAGSPGDFTPVSETVRFAPGQTERKVRIDARADGATESDEAYSVTVSSPTGDASVGTPARVAVTIPGPVSAPGPAGGAASPAPRCAGKRATIVGTRGRDVLRGTRRGDVIVSLGGNDRIRAGRGNDTVCAGSGRDRVSGDGGRDRLFGGAGNDRLAGGAAGDRLTGGRGRDTCLGGPGRDRGSCERKRSVERR